MPAIASIHRNEQGDQTLDGWALHAPSPDGSGGTRRIATLAGMTIPSLLAQRITRDLARRPHASPGRLSCRWVSEPSCWRRSSEPGSWSGPRRRQRHDPDDRPVADEGRHDPERRSRGAPLMVRGRVGRGRAAGVGRGRAARCGRGPHVSGLARRGCVPGRSCCFPAGAFGRHAAGAAWERGSPRSAALSPRRLVEDDRDDRHRGTPSRSGPRASGTR